MSRSSDRRAAETCLYCGHHVGPNIGHHPSGFAECEDCASPRLARDEAAAARRVTVHCGICGDGHDGTWLVHPSAVPAKCDRCGNPHLITKERTELERVEQQGRDLAEALGQGPRERFVRVGEVARYFNVAEQTVRTWVRDGAIRSVRTPGGAIRVPASELRPRGIGDLQR